MGGLAAAFDCTETSLALVLLCLAILCLLKHRSL